MALIFIDTHCSKRFYIGYYTAETCKIAEGVDAGAEIISIIHELSKGVFDSIMYITSPGSFTGLRIGSAIALGIAAGREIKIHTITVWDLLRAPNLTVLFYMGTKKWLKMDYSTNELIEIDISEITKPTGEWMCNAPELLPFSGNIPYPILAKAHQRIVQQQLK